MDDEIKLVPIAYIRTDYKEKFGIPRQSGRAPSSVGRIEFLDGYRNREAIRGIEQFSHLWLIFDFSEAHREGWSPTVRPPRLGGNTRMGVFATRSPFRPNPIGLSSVVLEKVCENGDLIVKGADLLDGTPIFDIKPYIAYTDSHPEAVGGFADREKDHKLTVFIPKDLEKMMDADKLASLEESLADDPRPSYQSDPERVYTMHFGESDISFKVDQNTLIVTGIEKK